MFERIWKQVVWRLIGVCLVAWGFYRITNLDADAAWQAYLGPGTLILAGLLMVSYEQTLAMVDAGLDRWKRFKAIQEETPAAATAANQDDPSSAGESIRQDVIDEDAPPPAADEWIRLLRPVLYQASHYSVPTYYLNPKLQIIDWNIAFELVFRKILGKIRNKHVNFLIVEMQNKAASFDHAREFTRKVRDGYLALVDIEPLIYRSEAYGVITFVKVAVLLSNAKGEKQGWSVALFPREIAWGPFQGDLFDKVREDKLWSVYSASYDRILKRFPPYAKLIADIVAAVPDGGSNVIDLGAGTGNVVAALVQGNHRVTAVESNLSMLEKLRERKFDPLSVTIVKGSVEFLDSLDPTLRGAFDAATMVNVLYAVDDPLSCLQSIFQLLKPGGVLAFSTTHSETRLDALLASIEKCLKDAGKYDALANDYEKLREANKDIERTIATRHSRDDYRQWARTAGFQIIKDIPSTYEGAVMLIHAMKPADLSSHG
jgi:ubiquinone/menaquinone biosynthesis C-methylase UbiE